LLVTPTIKQGGIVRSAKIFSPNRRIEWIAVFCGLFYFFQLHFAFADVTLRFDSLPSAQGWNYLSSGQAERSIFSTNGTSLFQNSLGTGHGGPGGVSAFQYYENRNVVDTTKPFVLEVRARVPQAETINSGGFSFGVFYGTESFEIYMDTKGINDGHGKLIASPIDNTVFHDFRLEGGPGINYKFFVDGLLVATGPSTKFIVPNRIFVGDGTSGGNAKAEMTFFRFTQSKALTIKSDVSSVWADGRKEAKLLMRLRDTFGNPIASRQIRVSAPIGSDIKFKSAAGGVAVNSINVNTDSQGEAIVTASSTKLGDISITAKDPFIPTRSDSTDVKFQKRKVAILIMGIRTDLVCDANGLCSSSQIQLTNIAAMMVARGFDINDHILWYSYNGGSVNASTGRWIAKSYGCVDTAKALRGSISNLFTMIDDYEKAHPNADFYILGHSQGGLLAFQSLGRVFPTTGTAKLSGIFTFDGALGGAPKGDTMLAAFRAPIIPGFPIVALLDSCWQGQAAQDMNTLYASAKDHFRQGSTAQFLCGLVGPCFGNTRTNEKMLMDNKSIPVTNFGNVEDGAFNPAMCGMNIFRWGMGIVNTSTQVVHGASGGLEFLKNNQPQPSAPILSWSILTDLNPINDVRNAISCATNSHAASMTIKGSLAVDEIGDQFK
jgi:hypothetical protein